MFAPNKRRSRQKCRPELARQAAARQAVPAALLATYDSLRLRRHGRVVVRLDGEVFTRAWWPRPHSRFRRRASGKNLSIAAIAAGCYGESEI